MHGSKDPKYRSVRVLSMLGTIPLILAVSPLMGYGLGYLLDRWLGTGQVLRLVFLGLGFVAGVREMIRLLKKAQRDVDEL
jgi:ATP synthase protein I